MKNLLGFVGISHLSLTYLLAATEKNYKIIAYDKNLELINKLKNNNENFGEKKLNKFLKKNSNKITFTNNINYLKKSNLVFISPDIKTNNKNESSYSELNNYIKKVDKLLPKKIPFIIQSQVYPGYSGNILNNKREIYYQVETLIFGQAIERALKPEQLIVGSKNRLIKNKIYKNYLKKFKSIIRVVSIEEAELCKIAINLFLASTLTTTNLLASYSEKMGIIFKNILPSLKLDKRIGKFAYLKPGLGISGGNIERDIINIIKLLSFYKIKTNFFKEIIAISEFRKNWVFNKVTEILKKNKSIKQICLFGITYKKNNSSIKNSPSTIFLKKINKIKTVKIKIYDDLISYYKNYKIYNTPNKALMGSDLLIIMRDFQNINIIKKINFNKYPKKKIVIDPFGVLEKKFYGKKNFNYFKIGAIVN